MNTQSNALSNSAAVSQTSIVEISAGRRLYWTVRRELWEYRSLYVAPLAVGVLVLVGSIPHSLRMHGFAGTADTAQPHNSFEQPYLFISLLLMGVALVVAIFYCLDTLHGERRDRSVLFWKSLPVSDLTTVLAKASIPIVILPVITFAITAVTQGIVFSLSTLRLLGSGNVPVWSHVPLLQIWAMEFYHLLAFHGLWYAPFYAWMLLASAWSRRGALLWAVLPPFAIGMLEKLVFNTTHFAHMLHNRFGISGGTSPKAADTMDLLMPLTPSQLFTSSGFWIGLLVTVLFLAAAVRLRQYRQPN